MTNRDLVLPPPDPDWDNPRPCTAPDPALTAALGGILNLVPQLRRTFERIERDGAEALIALFTADDQRPEQWADLARLLAAASRMCLPLATISHWHSPADIETARATTLPR